MFLPMGSRDEIGTIVENRFYVIEQFRKIASERAYEEISTPVIEYAKTFTNGYVNMKLQHMMKWFNSEGEIEVLRPDWTIAIARAIANQANGDTYPQKWAYAGPVFNQNHPGVISHQAGIELIHEQELLGDSECLLMAQKVLDNIHAGSYVIELGHAGIYEQIATQLQLSEQDQEQLRIAMHDKKKDEVYEIAKSSGNEQIATELATLVDAFGNMDVITEFEQRWSEYPELLAMLQHLKEVILLVGQSENVEILVDLGRVKNLPYYTGVMFRGFLKESGAVCFSGGRYDQLYDQFDQHVSAVGLAFEVDILAEKIETNGRKTKICLLVDDDTLAFAEAARKQFSEQIVDVQYGESAIGSFDEIYEVIKDDTTYKVVRK